MVSQILSLVVLATTVLAHPQRHHHWQFHGTGTGGVAAPTGGAFPMNSTAQTNNGTNLRGSPVESQEVTAVMTVTVSPIPLESSTDDGSDAAFSSVPVVANAAATSPAAASAPALSSISSACASGLISTITSTTVEFVTVTATPDASPVTDNSGKNIAAPSSSSTPSEDTGLEEGLAGSSASVSLAAGTPTAGAFFGRPSNGGGGGDFSFSAPGVGASASSVVMSALPTTFATMASSAPASGAASGTMASPSSTSSSTPSTGGGSSGGKKGLSYNTASLTDAFAGKGISWVYNWGATPDGTPLSGAEYVPMFWGSQSVSGWSSAVSSAISSGSKHVLSINEPDLSSQANLDPQTAAKLHIANVAPLSGQVQIGSPAVTNGAGSNPPMGTTWLSQFFDACAGQCNIDFVAFHWYSDASQTEGFKQHVQDVIETASQNGVSKVWLTEFGATGSDSDVASFMADVLPWLDSQPAVERYAYFMCSDGILVNGNSISSPIGTAYAS
ncbi:hypothetical protein H2204_003052 [Knufia peltigerae]|uniref:Asl1-like glycosyl hydrolase catalytic domain-containing protein n=1 Tax=Knufia peltigerae TaxID=1002370 RepID=A0AA38Y9V2_9EURO|nr:hypothetical protein H2204_003052 [Knufia peltigerae]